MIRQTLRDLVLTAGSLLPPRNADREVRFFYGHSLEAGNVPGFRRILRMLREHFEFVTTEDAVRLLRSADAAPGRYLAFSFDDGFRDCHDLIAPVLDEHGARACFFVATNFIECDEDYRRRFLRETVHAGDGKQPMTWDMVRSLADAGFAIGAHTQDHVNLAAVPLEEARRQAVGSRAAVESRTGRPCEFFAWPYGTAAHFPPSLLPELTGEFTAIFSAIRSRAATSLGGAAINRDHFEPDWPVRHVRAFATRRVPAA